jgi:RNA polymerase sigma-70 factor (ECF subfamily)
MTVIGVEVGMTTRGLEPPGGFHPLVGVEAHVRAAQRGDPAALDALVRDLMPYVGRLCGAIALDRGDDAMQETMIAVLRNLSSLREPSALRGWVRRIAIREAVRAARPPGPGGEADAGTQRLSPAQLAEVADRHPTPDVAHLATAMDVRATLAGLAPEQRAVLILRDLDGLSEAEVAELLDVPEGTVKSRLHRARSAFARRWRP